MPLTPMSPEIARRSSKPVLFSHVAERPEASQTESKPVPVANSTFTFTLDFASIAPLRQAIPDQLSEAELADDEVLAAAEKAGTFEFWNCPEDQIYDKPE